MWEYDCFIIKFVEKLFYLKITFLGTGTSQGIPVIGSTHPVCHSNNPKDRRLRVSVLLEWDDVHYVIDCGPDFRQQMLRANCQQLDGILFTHEHADHTAGLDDIRPYFFRQGDIPIYAHRRVIANLKRRFDYIFRTENRYPGAPAVQIKEIKENTSFYLSNKQVIPISGWHNTLQVFGFRVDNFAYLTDMKKIDDKNVEKLQHLEVLVINAIRYEPHHSHFNIDEALEMVNRLNPKSTYITHISHHLGFHDEVQQKLPKNIFLSYDCLTLQLP